MSRRSHLWLWPVLAVAACTGRVPGTTPAAPPPGYRPGVQEATPAWLEPQGEQPVAAEAYAPAAPAAPEPVPEYRVTLPPPESASAPAPGYEPSFSAPPAASSGSSIGPNAQRDRQIAILTEAVTALREEIARSYTHSQELVEETKKLRAQVRSLRNELDASKKENQRLRNQVRTLEKRLGEIRLTPPVETEPPPPPPEIPAEAAAAPPPEPEAAPAP